MKISMYWSFRKNKENIYYRIIFVSKHGTFHSRKKANITQSLKYQQSKTPQLTVILNYLTKHYFSLFFGNQKQLKLRRRKLWPSAFEAFWNLYIEFDENLFIYFISKIHFRWGLSWWLQMLLDFQQLVKSKINKTFFFQLQNLPRYM